MLWIQISRILRENSIGYQQTIVFPTSTRICVAIGIHLQALGGMVWL